MSPVPLRGMELALRYPGRSASPRTKRLRLDRLDGHESARLTTGLGPVSSRAVIDRMRLELVSVEVAE